MSCFLYVFRHSTGSERSDVLGVAVGVAVVMAYCGFCHTDVPRIVLSTDTAGVHILCGFTLLRLYRTTAMSA